VSAAREYESREPEPSLSGFVDRLSLLSDADEETGHARCARLDDDAAQRKGWSFRSSILAGLEEGCFRTRGRARTRRSSRRSGALLRRHDARAVAAGADRRARAGVFGEYKSSEPSRFIDEVPAELSNGVAPRSRRPATRRISPHYDFKTNPYGRGGNRR
jgi:DNA helicase-2/ATP-dependent DNA helicase PcrA